MSTVPRSHVSQRKKFTVHGAFRSVGYCYRTNIHQQVMKELRRKDRRNPAGWGIMCDRGCKKRSVSNLTLRAPRWGPPNRVLSKAAANNQRRPKEGLNSKINERLIYSIRLDPARLLGLVLFLIRWNSRQLDEMFSPSGQIRVQSRVWCLSRHINYWDKFCLNALLEATRLFI